MIIGLAVATGGELNDLIGLTSRVLCCVGEMSVIVGGYPECVVRNEDNELTLKKRTRQRCEAELSHQLRVVRLRQQQASQRSW